MAGTITTAAMPQWSVPIVESSGAPTREFFYFLLSLQTRTGGGSGQNIIPVKELAQNAFNLGLLDIAEESVPKDSGVLLGFALQSDDPAPRSAGDLFFGLMSQDDYSPGGSPALISLAYQDTPDFPAPLNPILSAIMVSDTA